MFFIGRRLIPDREQANELTEEFGLRPYLTEVLILPKSSLIGKTLEESGLGRDLDLTVLRVVRDKHNYLAPVADLCLEQGDVLLVEGMRDQILKIKDTAGISIKADAKLAGPDQTVEDLSLAEVILLSRSPLIGRRLKGVRFRERFGLQVLAINRRGETITRKISQVPLRMGDMLLLQGNRERIRVLEEENLFHVLGAVEDNRPNVRRAPIAIAIFAGAIAAATFNLMSLPVAMLLGSVLAFLFRCITPEEAYRAVEWKVLVLIGSMLAVGVAMESTGTATLIARGIAGVAGSAHPAWLLTAFFALTVLLAQTMSHQAAAVVVIPIAIQTAQQLGLNPRTFAMMIAIAASCSYLTPLEPSCLMVYGPGRYRFIDFVKVGSLLTLVIFLLAIFLVPIIWPLS
jgi:di/tricarboxylate transporter